MLRAIVRAVLIVAAALAALVIAGVGALWYVAPDMCGNEVLSEFPSPGGRLKVVVFQRDCGATTGFSTQASVLLAGAALQNDAGNVFVADTNHGAAPSGPGGGPAVSVEWRSESAVILTHHPMARVFKREPEAQGVSISYAEQAQQVLSPDARNVSPPSQASAAGRR